jgi:hypothetical protein
MKMISTAVLLLSLSLPAFAKPLGDAKEPDRTCNTEADCVPTCGLGGVSKKWFNENQNNFRDCSDGCMGWGQEIKCEKRKCTVYESDGKLSQRCNSAKYNILIVPI